MKELELTLSVRNNRLKARRREKGLSQPELAAAAGVSLHTYRDWESLRKPPWRATRTPSGFGYRRVVGEWHADALKLAAFYGCGPEELFPDASWSGEIRSQSVTVDAVDLLPLADALGATAPPAALACEREAALEALDDILRQLPEKERRVITLRFGLDGGEVVTLKEAGRQVGVSAERCRQIEARALRRMRRRSTLKATSALLEGEVDYRPRFLDER